MLYDDDGDDDDGDDGGVVTEAELMSSVQRRDANDISYDNLQQQEPGQYCRHVDNCDEN